MTVLAEVTTPAQEASLDLMDVTGLVRLGPCRALEHEFELFVPPVAKALRDLGGLVRPLRVRGVGDGEPRRYVLSHPDAEGKSVLSCDGRRLSEGRVEALDFRGHLSWLINQAVIETSLDRHWLMHAAAVTKAGYTIIMPADMESGKTTTTAGLLREDFGYVTDEAVALDPETLWLTPFPKALSIDPGSWGLFPELALRHEGPRVRQWHVPAADLGASTAHGPVPPPHLVVIPKYVGGDITEAVRLPAAEAAFELARMTFHFDRHPRRNLDAIARLLRRATVVRLRIGTLAGAVDAVEGLLSQQILEEW